MPALGKCPSCGEDLTPKDGKRRAQLPMLSPIFILYPAILTAVAVSLLLPLVGWLRHLLRRF